MRERAGRATAREPDGDGVRVRSPRRNMRRGTTITLAVLLLLIFGAAVLQFFFLAR